MSNMHDINRYHSHNHKHDYAQKHCIDEIKWLQMKRVFFLFVMGSLGSVILNILQINCKANLFPKQYFEFFLNAWWIIPFCGLAGVYIGLLYPFLDHKLGYQKNDQEWTSTIRGLFVFLGINHMCAKITFSNPSHFFFILIVCSAVYWFWFDKTWHGFVSSLINALVVLISANFLHFNQFLEYTETQFTYVQTCLLCLSFSGCICFANLGRLVDNNYATRNHSSHEHVD